MFSQSKTLSPLLPPSAGNSKKRFSENLNNSLTDKCDRSFQTAQDLLHKTGDNLRQTKLCFRKRKSSENQDDDRFLNESYSSQKSKTELFLLPIPKNCDIPKPQTNSHKHLPKDQKAENQTSSNDNALSVPMSKNGRNQIVLTGLVDFCLKMHLLYPNINAIWEVYGKLIKILPGESINEKILLLRSINGSGPVLQSVYFDINNILEQFQLGCGLRAVGRFVTTNRLKTFKLELSDNANFEECFSRIHNVISFVLLQNPITS